jgi:hypothetical protein
VAAGAVELLGGCCVNSVLVLQLSYLVIAFKFSMSWAVNRASDEDGGFCSGYSLSVPFFKGSNIIYKKYKKFVVLLQ